MNRKQIKARAAALAGLVRPPAPVVRQVRPVSCNDVFAVLCKAGARDQVTALAYLHNPELLLRDLGLRFEPCKPAVLLAIDWIATGMPWEVPT